MKKPLLFLFLACASLQADDDSFRERFADPATRTAALAELIPGSREAFFHTALDHQLAGREAEFRKMMAGWKAASERRETPVASDGYEVLENRQLLLDYRKDTGQSLAALIRRLDLKFDDTRPDAAAAAKSLPTAIAPEWISEAVFEKATSERSAERPPYTRYSGERLYRELERVAQFDEPKVRWFMENLDRSDLPGVVPLVEKAFELYPTISFDDQRVLRQLTAGQLETLLAAHPNLRLKESFAVAYLSKHLPGAETDFARDPGAHAAHLKFCRDFALAAGPAVSDSLKAHILYHHLRLQATLGNYPQEDFLRFLALPRASHPLLIVPESPARVPAINLATDFHAATDCPAVSSDVALIRDYLGHFLAATDDASAFAPYLPEKLLIDMHSRARLLAGADPTRWSKALDSAAYRELLDEVRIGFAANAPTQLDSEAVVSLPLDLKNTPDLLVRIYELDLPALLANTGRDPEVGIDLVGMVPHHERHLTFPMPAMQLHRETIALPELPGPGAWVVEFVSGQTSARALIRKGRLTPYIERTATGQTVRVFDEKGNPVTGATARLGRETLTADAKGVITVPDAPNSPRTSGCIVAGKLAVPLVLGPRTDEIELSARFHLEQEQLLADQEAKVHLRLKLTNHGQEIPLNRIKDPALVLNAQLFGDVTTERVIADDLKLAPVMEIPFQIPADLLQLTLTLNGSAIPTTGGDPIKLTATTTRELNGFLRTPNIASVFFSPTSTGHRLELRGRNGEPLPSRGLTLKFSRRGFSQDVSVKVRTDDAGRVDLGDLAGIASLTADSDGIASSYYPEPASRQVPDKIHVAAGGEFRIPLIADRPLDRRKVSLLEWRGGMLVRDSFEKIREEDGVLIIGDLPAGDFQLSQDGTTSKILVSSGVENGDLLISNSRILPRFTPTSPVVQSAAMANDTLKIQLRDSDPQTRVTVVGKRFVIPRRLDPAAPFDTPLPPIVTRGFTTSEYLTDRRLDDEVRYIFDRRAAKTFPGSMLPRPGLLLNRWTDEVLDQSTLGGHSGDDGSLVGAADRADSSERTGRGRLEGSMLAPQSAPCNFLQFPAAVKFDLTPAADGTLTLPLADFEGSQYLEITAAGPYSADQRLLPLAPNETPLRDRRIARPLDPQAHHLATRSAVALQKGAEASIENLLDADWRAFTTLAEAAQYFYGATNDERLREFAFLPDWPEFTEEKKLELLASHHSHEFHLFLARKDTAFFEKHVKPMLARKLEPQFMDDLLLQRDLTSYLRPYAWQRLNAAEKALLAQALPAARERVSKELSLRWQLEAPGPDAESQLFAQTLRGSDLGTADSLGLAANRQKLMEQRVTAEAEMDFSFGAQTESTGVSYITEKMKRIIIPRIDFEDTTVEEAIDFLRLRTAELDVTELDPSKKGTNFVIRRPTGASGDGDLSNLRIRELRLKNVPLGTVLKYICDQTKLRYKVDDFAVTLVPQTESGEDIFTRTFRVPPNFLKMLYSGGNEGALADPFAEPKSQGASLTARKPVLELLKDQGITFSEGSSATLSSSGVLLVTNTPSELDKMEQLVQAVIAGPADIAPSQADGVLPPLDLPADILPGPKPSHPVLPFADHTRLWHEANYFKSTAATDESLIPLNGFWLDLAALDGKGPFLSARFNACNHNANEALMALALLDLPFKAERPEVTVDGSSLRVKAREPMLLFYKDTRRTENVAAESPLLVRQTFRPLNEPFLTVEGKKVENPVTGDFRPGTGYQMSLVITNPTGLGRRIDLLAQVPAGSIPLTRNSFTASTTHDLPPYGVVSSELAFYFPAAGEFPVYPLQVSENGQILAHAVARTLNVSNTPAPVDAASWGVLASDGTNDQVLDRLRSENLKTLNLAAIRWRLNDAAFFQQVSAILRERLYFSPEIAAYGFHHNDTASIHDFLENQEMVRSLGDWLDSPLLDVRPRIHHAWETLEFDPLVNARAHALGGQSRLTHEAARQHYQAFLDQLAWKPTLDATDELTLTAFLFLQDRIEEGLARFGKIDPSKLPTRLHYDYLHAVVLFYQEKPADAKAIASQALPTVPPGLWQERFQSVIDQAEEISALQQPVTEQKKPTEAADPELDLALGGDGRLAVHHRGLERAVLRFYGVDLEVMFSKNPFIKSEAGTRDQPAILANAALEVALPAAETETLVELPEALRKGSVLVSAESGTRKLLKVLDSRALELRHTPESRTVQVLDAASSRPQPKTYVKVYAEMNDGSIVFHKDGYTDLRGKFDYLSNTAVDPATVKRLAILVSHPEKGARTVIYDR